MNRAPSQFFSRFLSQIMSGCRGANAWRKNAAAAGVARSERPVRAAGGRGTSGSCANRARSGTAAGRLKPTRSALASDAAGTGAGDACETTRSLPDAGAEAGAGADSDPANEAATADAPAGKAGKSLTSMALARCGDRYGDAATTLDGPLGTVRDKRTGVEEAAAAALAVEGARSARAARSGEVGRCGDDGAGWWATS